nr:hypothetical protein [uncultured bacterium]
MDGDFGSVTVADLLNAHGSPSMPFQVRDWLRRYVAGQPLPAADNVHPERFPAIEVVASVLADEYDGCPLPRPCYDYLREWLRALEQSSDVRVWNCPDLARVFLTYVFTANVECGDRPDGVFEALVLALRRLSTEAEFSEFQALHGLIPAKDWDEARRDDLDAIGAKAARLLADEKLPKGYRERLQRAVRELCQAAGITSFHPGLVWRALVLAMEAKGEGLQQIELDQRQQAVRALLDERG